MNRVRENSCRQLPAECVSATSTAFWIAVIAIACFFAHQLAFLFPDAEGAAMAVWPAGGIGLAALLLNPHRRWPAILATLFVAGNTADLLAGRPATLSIGFMTANVAESLVCAWLMTRSRGEVRFSRVREVIALLISAVVVNAGTALLAAVAAALVSDASFWSFWKTWAIAHGLGILLVTPMIVLWSDYLAVLKDVRWGRVLEGAAFLSVWTVLAWLAFDLDTPHALVLKPYILNALIAWAALRLGPRGVATAMAVLAAMTVTSEAVMTGPLFWGGDTPVDRLHLAQVYLGVTGITGYLLAAAYAESRSTERTFREMATALRDSEMNFRTFFESMTDMIVVGTREGRILFTNTAAPRTLGYTPEELSAMHLLELHPPEMQQEAEQVFAAMFRGERSTCPLPLACKDGSVVAAETRVWFGRWNGEDCVFGLCKNLTAEVEAQQRFERLFGGNPAPMAVSSLPERQFIDVNEAFLATTGFSRNEVVGKTSADLGLFCFPEQQDAVADKLKDRGRIAEQELQLRCKDGTVRDGLFSGEVIRSQGRQYFLTVMIDITDRKRTEETLRCHEERLQLVLYGADLGTWDWDIQTGEIVTNERWGRMLGYEPGELDPHVRSWEKLVHPEDLPAVREALDGHLEGRTPVYETEHRLRHKSGSWVWVLDKGRVIRRDPEGKPLRAAGTHLDITDRKQAEAELRRHRQHLEELVRERTIELTAANEALRREMTDRQKAEEASQLHRDHLAHVSRVSLLGELASGLAHEISQPLGAISVYASTVLQRLGSDDRAEGPVAASIEKIAAQARRASEVITHIRRFATGRASQRCASDINEITRSAVKLAGHKLVRSAMPIELKLGEHLPRVSVNGIQIEQVIINLLHNAVEAVCGITHEDCPLEISTALDSLGRVEVRVADRGAGIAPEISQELFQPFRTTKAGGMGIGLSISRTIIEAHEGKIWAEARPGGGTVFAFHLPAAKEGVHATN